MTTPFCFFMPGGEAGLTVLSRVAQSTSSGNGSTSITLPAGINAGDLIIFSAMAGDSNGIPGASIAGWSSVVNFTDGSQSRILIAAKIAVGTESSTSFNGFSGSQDQNNTRNIVVLRGNVPLTAVGTGQSINTQWATTTINQTISASSGTPPLLALAVYMGSAGDNLSAARGFTIGGSPAADDGFNTLTRHYLMWKFFPSAPANIAASLTGSVFGRGLGSAYVQLTT